MYFSKNSLSLQKWVTYVPAQALKPKQVNVTCKRCGDESEVTIQAQGLHAFICPYCGLLHLLLVDADLNVRDIRQIKMVPTSRPFDIARIRVKDETLIPVTLKPFWNMLKQGMVPPNIEEGLEALQSLGLLEVEVD